MSGLTIPVPSATSTIEGKQVLVEQASQTLAGKSEIASVAEVNAGLDGQRIVTPAGLLFGMGICDIYQSGEITMTPGSLSTNAHGFGRTPKIIQLSAICKTVEDGWSIGDEFLIHPTSPNGSSSRRPGVYSDASNIYLRFPNSSPVLQYMNKGSGAFVDLTDANWRIKINAWG
ncbi:MAG: hypothetical protein PQ612_06455 [Rickettsiales bacterium]|nr:hypothetical protein [Pseudomonadota bacterium]MDA0966614.1 hypothetical protein [Pseudomonadota bacterium]MDG4543642.1 hypothetical protein [Rickettsiales bacterium]MDG4545789.1 hypothetical protein [Rickettsiales bacterium]MDG4547437.1 hypothetical protein [Rickettsiales bacterium]